MAKATGIGMGELKRFTGLLAGRHLYQDEPGQPPQLVEVDYIEGTAYVTFLDVEAEDGEVMLQASDMAGTFKKAFGHSDV
jgi:hypothetical protein